MMTGLYPRTVDLHRANTNAANPATGAAQNGLVGYSGMSQSSDAGGVIGETVIATGLQCSIQARGIGRVTGAGVTESDSPGPVQWRVFFPPNVLAKGVARDRDILIDDEGYRYRVASSYPTALGVRLDCIRLEA